MRHHLYRSFWKRGLWSFSLIACILLIGTVGIHLIEGFSYLDAFYFMSMIATAQGPATAPVTAWGKMFTALIAFVSVGAGLASLGFVFGPFLGTLLHVGVEKVEEELERLKPPTKK